MSPSSSSSTKLIMMMMVNIVAVSCLVFILISLCATRSEAAITCPEVNTKAGPCMGYARGDGDANTVPTNCCDGMRGLCDAAKTVDDKKAVCGCLKVGFGMFGAQLDESRLNQIPTKCDVVLPFKLSKTPDCDSIK